MYSAYYKQLNAFFVSSYGHDNSDIAGYVNFVGSNLNSHDLWIHEESMIFSLNIL